MVQAARKYNRVVQAGTMQRSGGYFRKAAELVAAGTVGDITFCHTFQSGSTQRKGYGNPPDSDPPAELDWDMWLGPAPKVPFNANRWGVKAAFFPTFRYFWDYAGGAMTDWGVHLIDPLHQCFGEVMPTAVVALGDKFYVQRQYAKRRIRMHATFYYPKFLTTYESRTCNPLPLFGRNQGAGTTIHGTEGTILVNRSGCWVIPNSQIETGGGFLGERSGNGADERSALEELGGVHQDPAEAHQRNRNLRALLHGLPAGQPGACATRSGWSGTRRTGPCGRMLPSPTSRRVTGVRGSWRCSRGPATR